LLLACDQLLLQEVLDCNLLLDHVLQRDLLLQGGLLLQGDLLLPSRGVLRRRQPGALRGVRLRRAGPGRAGLPAAHALTLNRAGHPKQRSRRDNQEHGGRACHRE
jgi:hypothetical protein